MCTLRGMFTFVVVVLLGCFGVPVKSNGQVADSPWPSFQNNVKNTGLSENRGTGVDSLKWRYETEGDIDSSPAIGSDGTIYVGSNDGYLYAINPDGTLKWRYYIDKAEVGHKTLDSSPAVGADGTIYIGSATDSLYAIEPDGSLKWRYETGSDIDYSSPVIGSDGTIYIGSGDKHLHAINPDGSLKWKFETGDLVQSSPAIGEDGTIFIGSFDNHLYALNPDGSLKASYEVAGSVKSSPAIGSDGTLYFGTLVDTMYAVNADGSLKWKYGTEAKIHSSPAIGPDGTVYIGSEDDYLYAFNPDGSLKWKYKTDWVVDSSPAIGADGTIFVGSYDDHLYAFDVDGTLKWKYKTDDHIYFSSPSIGSDGTIYVGSHDRHLYAIGEINNAPDSFKVISPSEEEIIATSTPVFKWEKAVDPDLNDTVTYTLQIDGPESDIMELQADTADSIQIEQNLVDKSFYSWRVIAEDRSGAQTINTNGYTEFIVDTANQAPQPFNLITPTDGSVESTLTPFFSWEKPVDENIRDTLSYRLYLAADSAFGSADSTIVDTNSVTLSENLQDNSRFFWYVKAEDQHGAASVSDTLWFWVNTELDPPAAFEQISPEEGTTGLPAQPELMWEKSLDSDPMDSVEYTVIIAKDEELVDERIEMEAGKDTSATPQSPLGDDTKYYWSVTAMDTDSLRTHTDTLSFVVGTITDLEDSEDLPDAYKLYPPYPSPFNPQTNIKYDLPKSSSIEINVYNIMGRKIRTLIDKQQSAGTYTVMFNASNLPSGSYIIRLKTGSYAEEKPVILLK